CRDHDGRSVLVRRTFADRQSSRGGSTARTDSVTAVSLSMPSTVPYTVVTIGELAGIVAMILALISVLVYQFKNKSERSVRGAFGFLAACACVYAGVLAFVPREERWRWDLSGLPALLIVNHAIFLMVVRQRAFPSDSSENQRR